MRLVPLTLLATALLGGLAHADPVALRMASIAPDGTSYARELRAFARDVESATRGEVRVKWYIGGIAGDELGALERVRHGQLDGIAGSSFCERLAPSLRVISVVGLFQNRDEVAYVMGQLNPVFGREFAAAGFVDLVNTIFGSDILFSRRPVANMSDFRSLNWWVWNGSPLYPATFDHLNARSQAATLEQAAIDFERGKNDGFVALPSAAIAFQWSTLASYFTPLNIAMVPGCMVISNGALDPLSVDQQQHIRDAAARFQHRWNETTASLDQALVGQLFEKQGLRSVPVSPQFRMDFFEAARAAREHLGDRLVPRELLNRVQSLLADYRAEHHSAHR
jgi:TRAP-type C4-dicarboxylate transport system substrate-binding protein